MREIPLQKGIVALVDGEDYDFINQYQWFYKQSNARTGYAARGKAVPGGGYKIIMMHNVIMPPPRGFQINHINGNGLDNRKENLRFATRAQSQRNKRIQKNNVSGFKGVSWKTREGMWRARITVNSKDIELGFFKIKEEAALAYNEAALKYHGEFAILNQIMAAATPAPAAPFSSSQSEKIMEEGER